MWHLIVAEMSRTHCLQYCICNYVTPACNAGMIHSQNCQLHKIAHQELKQGRHNSVSVLERLRHQQMSLTTGQTHQVCWSLQSYNGVTSSQQDVAQCISNFVNGDAHVVLRPCLKLTWWQAWHEPLTSIELPLSIKYAIMRASVCRAAGSSWNTTKQPQLAGEAYKVDFKTNSCANQCSTTGH